MNIGVPKELKDCEGRVGLVPSGVRQLTDLGHTVYIQRDAGLLSNISNQEYTTAGAVIVNTIQDVYYFGHLIVKVKEPIEQEYNLLQSHHYLFCFLHLASNPTLVDVLTQKNVTYYAYESVHDSTNQLPILKPMSEIAGRISAQKAAEFLQLNSHVASKGKLIGGTFDTAPATVLVLGAGVVGTNAAKVAAGMGANVLLMDIDTVKIQNIQGVLPWNVITEICNIDTIKKVLPRIDAVIGSVYIRNSKTPHLITKDMLDLMSPRSVLVDVAIDQGGCFETSRLTTHTNPVFVKQNIIHYCVPNIPGIVPYTSTLALTNATLPYIKMLAEKKSI